jgi:hypothetical protein
VIPTSGRLHDTLAGFSQPVREHVQTKACSRPARGARRGGEGGHKVTFATLNVQGSCNNLCSSGAGDPDGFHDLLSELREKTIALRKPVVLVHGDSHYFMIDKPLLDADG